ncbi:MAG: hypothetical protein ABIO70_20675, partial [Pseudomonadota bacterium]
MASITPCRTLISDRFPVAAFVIRVPATRCFEVACTTDPLLLQRGHLHRRDPSNFFTTRLKGLMRAPAGEATVLIPPDQLIAFAGSRRIYYALGSYETARGEGAEFSVDPGVVDRVPYVQLSPDFTGRSLERARLGSRPSPQARWGRGREQLLWGGDMIGARQEGRAVGYDDGFDPSLWAAEGQAGGGLSRALAGGAPYSEDDDPSEPDLEEERDSEDAIPAYQASRAGAADEYGARGTPRDPQQLQAYAGAHGEPPGVEHPPASPAGAVWG